jgi:NAD(P)H-dependent FMN reductase
MEMSKRNRGPPAVQRLNDRIAAADGLLIVTPEYNNSMPGALKNARSARAPSRTYQGNGSAG